MDIYFWLAQLFQVALIALFIIAWRKSPKDETPEAPAPPPEAPKKPE